MSGPRALVSRQPASNSRIEHVGVDVDPKTIHLGLREQSQRPVAIVGAPSSIEIRPVMTGSPLGVTGVSLFCGYIVAEPA